MWQQVSPRGTSSFMRREGWGFFEVGVGVVLEGGVYCEKTWERGCTKGKKEKKNSSCISLRHGSESEGYISS